MPLTGAATDVFGIGTLVLVILCCGAGALCSVYVFLFHFKVSKELLPLRDFDSPWVVRVVLIGLCVLWSLGELFRLPWLRKSDGILHNVDLKIQGNLCRLHVVWSVGIMEPGFLLTLLFLIKGSLHQTSSASRNFNSRALILMGLFCSPIFILQLLLVLTSHSGNQEGFGGSIPTYFTKCFEVMYDDAMTPYALCTYPLFSILLLGLFSCGFVLYFSCLGLSMIRHVVNRKLQKRVYSLLLAVVIILPLHVSFLGCSVRVKPSETAHEVLLFLGFLALLLCATGGLAILVILPVADALAVHRFFKRRDKRGRGRLFCTSPAEPFGRAISAVVSDDDEPPHHFATHSLLGAVSSTGTDAGSSSRASLTFDTVPKDLTLGPGGWLVDIPGSMTSPSSVTFPGGPLTIS